MGSRIIATLLFYGAVWALVSTHGGQALGRSPQSQAGNAQNARVVGEPFVYKQVPDGQETRSLRVYVTKPESWQPSDRRPAIVFFHGGGWVGGAPGQFTEHAKYFASRGMVCFQVEYRLLDRKTKEPPITCTQDAVDAMRWVRQRCDEFGVDCQRIAAAGGSAGGHLAAYLGCIDPQPMQPESRSQASSESVSDGDAKQPISKPNALLLFNPVYDNGPGGWGTERVGDRYPEFSPFHNVTADDPPSIVFLGSNDSLIPVATAEKFRDKCLELGINSELHIYDGQPHGFFNYERSNGVYYYQTVIAADAFLARLGWLEGAPTLEAPNTGND